MNRIEGFITAHIGEPINECDDNFAFDLNKCNFAIADGSSSDFFSKIYARILTDKFVEDPNAFYDEDNVKRINFEWRSAVKEKLDEAGCRQGSFPYVRFQRMDPGCSTLIGLNFFEEEGEIKYRCSGLGDSVLFFKPEDSDIPTLQFSSYSNAEFSLDQNVEFGYTPVISRSYSTQWIENIKEYSACLSKGIFYLMTDGMAEWILRSDNGTIKEKFLELDDIHSQEDFLVYVASIRELGAHNDDMTLLKIYVDEVNMDFDPQKSVVFDYRTEQDKIDVKEAQSRSLKRQEEEKKTKSGKATSKNSLDWIANVVSTQKKQQEKTQQRIQSDERGKMVLQTPQVKVKDEMVTGNDISAKKYTDQEQNVIEHQNTGEESITRRDEECDTKLVDAEKGTVNSTKNIKDEENDLNKECKEAKKTIPLCPKKNYEWIIIIVLILSNIYFSFDYVLKTTDSQRELTNLKELHNTDSVKIVELIIDLKKQEEEILKLKKDVALYQKREEYLKTYPTAYKNVMKIKE